MKMNFSRKVPGLIAAFLMCFNVAVGYGEELRKHSWEVGPEIFYYEYEEPGIMSNEGWFSGIAAAYTYHRGVMFRAEGRFSAGQVDYSSKTTGSDENIDDYACELRALGGYDFSIGQATFVTPYIGVGTRYLNDDSSGSTTTTGALGYERESYYLYTPVGVKVTSKLDKGWTLEGTAEYDHLWRGKQISRLSDVNAGYNDPENRQTHGYGIRGAVAIEKKAGRLSIALEPFVRYWYINNSNWTAWTLNGAQIGAVREPRNNTTEVGLSLKLKF